MEFLKLNHVISSAGKVVHYYFTKGLKQISIKIGVFFSNINLTLLAFLHTIDIQGFQTVSTKNKVTSSGNSTHNTGHHWLKSLSPTYK